MTNKTESSGVSAVLFVKDLQKVAAFYSDALAMQRTVSDEHHCVLNCYGFTLIIHQIPSAVAAEIAIEQPPVRRVWDVIRLDYPVPNLTESRRVALLRGGGIDEVPPEWAGADANFFFGYDPEGNQFGTRQQA